MKGEIEDGGREVTNCRNESEGREKRKTELKHVSSVVYYEWPRTCAVIFFCFVSY